MSNYYHTIEGNPEALEDGMRSVTIISTKIHPIMSRDTAMSMSQQEIDVPMADEPDDVQGQNPPSTEHLFFMASTDSELSVSESNAKRISLESKKRKAQDEKTRGSHLKRLRTFYNDGYRNLLNDTMNEIVKKTASDELKRVEAGQIGITRWSVEEKEIFFSALATKGKDNHLGVAADIGTKTELEVLVYLQLLQSATIDHHLHDRRQQLSGLSDIPGAFEIGKDCCDALDLAADALGVLQEKMERDAEIEKYGNLGLLDTRTAQLVEGHFHQGEDDEKEVSRVLPAAQLLNLKSHLKLSSHLFMNSNDAEYNWRSYVGRNEGPSILHTAFSDFHSLAVSVTRRLIQSTLFFAMSRLRAMNTPNYTHQQHVRREDVTAALNVLGMKHTAHSYWAGVAKRCNLDVYEDLKRKTVEGKKLDYEEVERRLNQPRRYKTKSAATTPEGNDRYSSTSARRSVHENNFSISEHTSEDLTEATASTYDSEFSHRQCRNNASTSAIPEQDQDVYAEAIDLQASHLEEQRLWKMLSQEAPERTQLRETKLPKNPGANRKSREDLDDWRGWVSYVGEWEAHEIPISASELTTNRRTFRGRRAITASTEPTRTSRVAGNSDDGSGSGDSDNDDGRKDDAGSPDDKETMEDEEGSDISIVTNETSPATNVEDYSDEGGDEFGDQEGESAESQSLVGEEEAAEDAGEQGGSELKLNTSASEDAEDLESVCLDVRQQGKSNTSDDDADSDIESMDDPVDE